MDEEAMEQEGDEGPSSEGQRREQQSRKYAKLKSKLRARIKTQKANRNKKRPGFSVKVATLKNNLSRSVNLSNSSVHHLHCERELRTQNQSLAEALNQQLQENRALVQKIEQLQEEKVETMVELSSLRGSRRDSGVVSDGQLLTQEEIEQEIQKRLVAYSESMKPFVNNILNHAVNITEDIGQVLSLVSAPGRRSRSMAASHAANASTSGGNKSSLGKSIDTTPLQLRRPPSLTGNIRSMRPQQEKKSVVAHVSPRVGGHAIHKPTIEIDRLGGDEIIRYLERQAAREAEADRNREEEEEGREDVEDSDHEEERAGSGDGANDETDEELEQAEDDEDEPLQRNIVVDIQRGSRRSRYNEYRMSMISENEFEEEEEETEEEASPSVRRRRRRRQTQQQPRSRLITPQRRSSNASIGNSGSRRNSPFQNLNNSPVVLLQDASVLLDQYNLQRQEDTDPHGEDHEEHSELHDTRETEDDEEESGNNISGSSGSGVRERVILMPTLVLERIKVTEKKPGAGRRSILGSGGNRRSSLAPPRPSTSNASSSRASIVGGSRLSTSGAAGTSGIAMRRDTFLVPSSQQTEALPEEFLAKFKRPGTAAGKNWQKSPKQDSKPKRSRTQVDPASVLPPALDTSTSSEDLPETSASSSSGAAANLENNETPRSRETAEDFALRMCQMDALEGPSWLFSDSAPAASTAPPQKQKKVSSKGTKGRGGSKLPVAPARDEGSASASVATIEPEPTKPRKSSVEERRLERVRRTSNISLQAQIGPCSKKLNMSLSDEGEKETPIKVLETSDDEDEKETPINVPETSDEEEEKESPPEAEHLGLPEGASADLTVVASPSSPLPKKRTRKTVAWRQPSLQELEQAGEEEDEPPKKRRATKGRKSKKAEKTPETEVTPASEEPELQQLDLPEEDSPSISNSPASERSPPVSSSPSSPGVSSSSVPTTSRQNSLVPPATTAYPVQSPAAIELGRASAASATTNSRESSLGTVDDDGGGRPRRRAAAAAQGALKEPKLGTKMRQGDPKSVSVYPDYVPQIKAASGRRSSSSSKSSAAPAEKAKGRKKK